MKVFWIVSDVKKKSNRGFDSIVIKGFSVMKLDEEIISDEVEPLFANTPAT